MASFRLPGGERWLDFLPRRSAKIGGREILAVLFDLDETLVDAAKGRESAHARVSKVMSRALGRVVEPSAVAEGLAKLDDEMNMLREYDRDLWWQKLADRLGCGVKLPRPLLKALTKAYWEGYAEAAKPYGDAEEVLRYLLGRGYVLGIVTDTDAAPGVKRRRINMLPFADLFDAVVIAGEDTERVKPDKKAFLLAARRLGVPSYSCAFVGDKPFTDIEGAKAAGMATILVRRRRWAPGAKADFTVSSLAGIKKVL